MPDSSKKLIVSADSLVEIEHIIGQIFFFYIKQQQKLYCIPKWSEVFYFIKKYFTKEKTLLAMD